MFDAAGQCPMRRARNAEVEKLSRSGRGRSGSRGEEAMLLRSTSRTQRNPMLLFLFSGSFLLRYAARRFLASLLNAPPRLNVTRLGPF